MINQRFDRGFSKIRTLALLKNPVKLTMNKLKMEFSVIRQIGQGFKELFFPDRDLCPVCRREPSEWGGLGTQCFSRISLINEPICQKCGRPLRLKSAAAQLCEQCSTSRYYFSQARAVALYEGALREDLADLKYRYRPELGWALGLLLVEWVKLHRDFQTFDFIIPIPIHSRKLALRGYNQAELLANPLQRYLGIALKNDIIIRDKFTESQSGLDRTRRFANINEAFRVVDARSLAGKKILLVDDILTTGATASEASRVLLRAGALEVKVLTLAAGVIDSQWFIDSGMNCGG